jgi:hypothetical protein
VPVFQSDARRVYAVIYVDETVRTAPRIPLRFSIGDSGLCFFELNARYTFLTQIRETGLSNT